jgi:hypothetical protein
MGRGLLSDDMLALITEAVPSLGPLYDRVLPLSPDLLSFNFARDSTIPTASACYIDTLHTLAEARSALFEVYAHAFYYRVVGEQPSEFTAVFFEKVYSDHLAHCLYAAGEHLAAGIAEMMEVRSGDLAPYRRRSRSSKQAVLAAYLKVARPDHPVTNSVRRLGVSSAWRAARRHRDAVVHGQPPLLEGTGVVYKRGSRWRTDGEGRAYVAFGGGDQPTTTTAQIVDFLHDALVEFIRAYTACIDAYWALLEMYGATLTEKGLEMTLRFPRQ